MLALKKKREAEAAAAASTATVSTGDKSAADEATNDAAPAKVSLIGAIGGKKTKDKAAEAGKEGTSGSKKRTPGEIRIQKGT